MDWRRFKVSYWELFSHDSEGNFLAYRAQRVEYLQQSIRAWTWKGEDMTLDTADLKGVAQIAQIAQAHALVMMCMVWR